MFFPEKFPLKLKLLKHPHRDAIKYLFTSAARESSGWESSSASESQNIVFLHYYTIVLNADWS